MGVPTITALHSVAMNLYGTRGGVVNLQDRISFKLDEWYRYVSCEDEHAWLPLDDVQALLLHELGFTNAEEFETALGSSLREFAAGVPTIDVNEFDGRHLYKMSLALDVGNESMPINV